MVEVSVELKDRELLGWFSELRIAFEKADGDYNVASKIDKEERTKDSGGRPSGTLVNPKNVAGGAIGTPAAVARYKNANSDLIDALNAVIAQVRKASDFDRDASLWME